MNLRKAVSDEFARSPVSVIGTIVGLLIAASSLLIAWLRYSTPSASPPIAPPGIPAGFSVPNLLLVISFFLAVAFAGASLIRMAGRSHPFQAAILSILVGVLVSFLSTAIFTLIPPRALTDSLIESAAKATFYGTIICFLTVNGLPLLFGLGKFLVQGSDKTRNGDAKESDGTTFLVALALVIVLWGVAVGSGQSMLIETFLLDPQSATSAVQPAQ